MKKTDYFRDAPNNGNLNVSHKLGCCSMQCEDDTLIGAYMMRLVGQGCLEAEVESVDAKEVKLHLCHAPRSGNEYDDALYTILEAAAGGDGILQPNEFEQFCENNEVPLYRFVDSCERNAMQYLLGGGCVKGAELESWKKLTKKGLKELDELLGLKHFLLDFSLIQERGVQETVIWQDYMVYALMLGIADTLEKQIRDLYPNQIPQLNQYHNYIQYTNYYNGMMYRAYERERQRHAAARSGGSGGRASFGGGGGFSGGGRGGSR